MVTFMCVLGPFKILGLVSIWVRSNFGSLQYVAKWKVHNTKRLSDYPKDLLLLFNGLALCSQDSFVIVIFLLFLMSKMWTNHLLLRFWQQTHICLRVGKDRGFLSSLLTSLLGWGVWRVEWIGSAVRAY